MSERRREEEVDCRERSSLRDFISFSKLEKMLLKRVIRE
jgi:hypothetical protein